MNKVKSKRKLTLPTKMLIGLVLGAAAGFVIGEPMTKLYFLGEIFMKLLKMCIYPLILVSIMQGISQVSDMNRLKKVGTSFFTYWLTSGIAIGFVGVIVSLIMKPGIGINMGGEQAYELKSINFLDNLVGWVPSNPFDAMASGDVLQIIVVALIFGLMLAGMKEGKTKTILVEGVDAMNTWVGRVIAWVITLAPYGVFVIMSNMTATLGLTVIGGILKMLVTMYVIFAIMFLVIYPFILIVFAKVNPLQFYKNIIPSMIMAFSTCSSSATIPVTMQTAKENLGVPEDIVNLITAPAATLNMHANCLQTPLYCIFAAQLYGVQLSASQIFITVALGLISAMGAAGVPGGGFVMITLVLEVMGLPLTVVPWIIGIYTLIDMPGTLANVTGDSLGMTVVAARLGELKRDIFNGLNRPSKELDQAV